MLTNQHWGTRNTELKGETRIKRIQNYWWGKRVPKTTEPAIIAIFQTLQNKHTEKITWGWGWIKLDDFSHGKLIAVITALVELKLISQVVNSGQADIKILFVPTYLPSDTTEALLWYLTLLNTEFWKMVLPVITFTNQVIFFFNFMDMGQILW